MVLGEVELRTVYIAPDVAPLSLSSCAVIEVSDLMRALFEALSDTQPDSADASLRRQQLTALLLTEIRRAPPLSLGLPMLGPPPARPVDAAPASVAADAGRVGGAGGEPVSARWRGFQRELRMSFAAWRQQLRLAHALDGISRGRPLGEVASELGYASQPAFSAMFKRAFGVPPGQFFAPAPLPEHGHSM